MRTSLLASASLQTIATASAGPRAFKVSWLRRRRPEPPPAT